MTQERKFYNFATLTKVSDKIVATLEGNVSKELESKEVIVNGETRKVSRFNLAVNGNLQSRFDYASKKDRKESYPDATFVQVVGWDKTAEAFEKVIQKGRKVEVSGVLVEKSFEGKNGTVFYLELTVSDRQNFRGLGAKKNSDESSNIDNSGSDETPLNQDPGNQIDDDMPF